MSFRVVVVGRPNVGKSALFNRLLSRKRSLVHGLPGMTRDFVEEQASLPDGRSFTLIDTGGFDPADRETIPAAVRRQALAEIRKSDLVILVLDASAGILPADLEAVRVVRSSGKPCFVAANKIDRKAGAEGEGEAYELGFPDVFGVSAEHNLGVGELLEAITERLPPAATPVSEPDPAASEERVIAVAIVGRPNVGKSSLLNALAGYERSIVSEVAGTTRDSVDLKLPFGGKEFLFIDTAGVRRKGKTERGPEVMSVVAARKRVERAAVALVVFDAAEGPTSQDASVAAYAAEKGKGILFVANKWDLAPHERKPEDFRQDVLENFPFARYAPLVRVSAKTGRGVAKLPAEILRVAENRNRRVPTGELNRLVRDEFSRRPPKGESGRQLKVLYASQTGTRPPSFSLVASRAEALYYSDARRLENVLRRFADFAGTPIFFHVSARKKGAER
jgi:GTP-binding protein